MFSIQIQHPVPRDTVEALLFTAIEGGSSFWCQKLRRISETGLATRSAVVAELLDDPSCRWRVQPHEDPPVTIGRAELERGFNLLSKYPHHLQTFLRDGDASDAELADVWFQLACFGEIVYG